MHQRKTRRCPPRLRRSEGFKQSGFGRELGMHAMEGYSEIENVFFSTERTSEL